MEEIRVWIQIAFAEPPPQTRGLGRGILIKSQGQTSLSHLPHMGRARGGTSCKEETDIQAEFETFCQSKRARQEKETT
jgi:hypothetical protein